MARNDQGKALQLWSVARDSLYNLVVAELDAVRVALLITQQNSWLKIEIQIDIKAIADCLQI